MLNWQQILNNSTLIQTGLLINGNWETDRNKAKVFNPFNNELIAEIAEATKEDIKESINSALAAYLTWRDTNTKVKAKVLRRWFELMLENVDDLAKIMTLENGKPLSESKAEIYYAASYLEWYAEECRRIDGNIIPSNQVMQKIMIIKQAIGVCVAISPWNFPTAMLARKVAPAIAAGCSIIARPSSQTPLSALAFAKLALDAGLPSGVFNILLGDSSLIANALCKSDVVKKISFTGSTEVGIELYKNSADTMKRISLELGGNAPFIVFKDADIIKAVSELIKNKFRNSGQTCICANRVFIENSIKDEFLSLLKLEVAKLKVGNGMDIENSIGPLINKKAIEHTIELVNDAISKGAELVLGGNEHSLGGNFFEPTILINCNNKMRIFNEEIFAPVIAIYDFYLDEEVIELANNTKYGLASYFYSNDINRIFNISEKLEYGMVGINTGVISAENVPFGGIKHSGLGREGGRYGIEEYLNIKYLCLNLN